MAGVRAPLFYALIVVVLGMPRIFGTPWHAIAGPNSVREFNGSFIQYESSILIDFIDTMRMQRPPTPQLPTLPSDAYRALIPLYTWALLTSAGLPPSLAMNLTDLLYWWLGVVAVHMMAKQHGLANGPAFSAGILTAASPLAVAFIGGFGLHTASSLSLPFLLMPALRARLDRPFYRIFTTSCVLLVSSLFYNYHISIFAILLLASIVEKNYFSLLIDSFCLIVYIICTFLLHYFLAPVFSFFEQSNSPFLIVTLLAVNLYTNLASSETKILLFIYTIYDIFLTLALIIEKTCYSYDISIVCLALCSLATLPSRLWRLLVTSVGLAIVQSMLYAPPWVLMSAFPLVYIGAGVGIHNACRWVTYHGSLSRFPDITTIRLQRLLSYLILLAASLVTNLDLFGYSTFVIRWWQWWYVPR